MAASQTNATNSTPAPSTEDAAVQRAASASPPPPERGAEACGHQDVKEFITLVSAITSTSSGDSLAKARQAATSASLSYVP